MTERIGEIRRETKETKIFCALKLNGQGRLDIDTGIGFLDHMLSALAFHAGFDLTLNCKGDLPVDDHHTAEDCALALGAALDKALGEQREIQRFGWAYAPLDEALCRVVVDCSRRPAAIVNLPFDRDSIGALATENVRHFFVSFAMAAGLCLHVDLIRGENDHHRAESAFKALALALRQAVAVSDRGVLSSKGAL